MKIKDLILKLEKFDSDMDIEVFCEGDDFVSQNTIKKIEVRDDVIKKGEKLIIIDIGNV